jgi:hypothetical protein
MSAAAHGTRTTSMRNPAARHVLCRRQIGSQQYTSQVSAMRWVTLEFYRSTVSGAFAYAHRPHLILGCSPLGTDQALYHPLREPPDVKGYSEAAGNAGCCYFPSMSAIARSTKDFHLLIGGFAEASLSWSPPFETLLNCWRQLGLNSA